ncbi:MAG: hypothetical protein HYX84_09350 [Chloroflexi bacterium]|nr:hypothetical protein [Chloroflexota bacterium]
MKPYEMILLTLLYSGDKKMIAGRTLFQKTIYFINEKMKTGIEFDAHYYGPYSATISDELESLSASGIITECIEVFPSFNFGVSFEPRKYSYCLTDSGIEMAKIIENQNREESKTVMQIMSSMREAGIADDYKSLSVAAKMHHILKARPMRFQEVLSEAKQLGWTISEDEAREAVKFLTTIELVKIETSKR